MRKTYRPKKKVDNRPKYPKNSYITAEEIKLIDETGEIRGVILTKDALAEAREKNLDLVLVSPKTNPPVAKFLDYGKYQYQQEKILRKQKAKQKKVDIKGIRLSLKISKHDKNIRIEQAKKFLEKGHKIKFELNLRGREHQHTDLAVNIVKEIIETLKVDYEIETESPIAKQGGKIITLIHTKKN